MIFQQRIDQTLYYLEAVHCRYRFFCTGHRIIRHEACGESRLMLYRYKLIESNRGYFSDVMEISTVTKANADNIRQ